MKRTLLLDTDVLIYVICLSGQHAVNWADEGDPDLWTLWAKEDEAIARFKSALSSYMDALNASDAIMCLTDYSSSWRKAVLPTYKSNRKDTIKPLLINRMRQYVQENYTTFLRPGMEGDDLLGILSTHPHLVKGEKVILTIDKDLRSVPGLIAKMPRERIPDEIEIEEITKEQADWFHAMQTLTGDAVDGYVGCPGVGPETARKFIDGFTAVEPYEHTIKSGARKGEVETRWRERPATSTWDTIVSLYQKAGLTEADALVQARVARICRHTDYNFKTREPILWNPAPIAAE